MFRNFSAKDTEGSRQRYITLNVESLEMLVAEDSYKESKRKCSK